MGTRGLVDINVTRGQQSVADTDFEKIPTRLPLPRARWSKCQSSLLGGDNLGCRGRYLACGQVDGCARSWPAFSGGTAFSTTSTVRLSCTVKGRVRTEPCASPLSIVRDCSETGLIAASSCDGPAFPQAAAADSTKSITGRVLAFISTTPFHD